MLLDVRVQFERMLTAAMEAIEYAAQTQTLQEWQSNKLVRRAVERCLINLGEEAASLRKLTSDSFDDVPLKEIAGFRHRLVHDYLRIDDSLVFEIIRDDCPAIIIAIQNILDTHP